MSPSIGLADRRSLTMHRLRDADMPSSLWKTRFGRSLLVGGSTLLLLVYMSGIASPAIAQSVWGQSTWNAQDEEQAVPSWGDPVGMGQPAEHESGSGFSGGVPKWAAPRETPPGTWSPDVRNPSGSKSEYDIPRWGNAPHEESSVGMNAPTNPNDPNKVPIDGGLGLLMVAGVGYAAHRLRKKEGDTDTDDAPLP